MTIRIQLLPYGPSDSCVELRNALREAITSGNLDARVTLLRHRESSYTPRSSDVVVNYGNRHYPQSFYGNATVLNSLDALNRAANKLTALNVLSQAGVPTVEYTTDRNAAQVWVDGNETVYARGTLNGHSGEGITVHSSGNTPAVPAAPLYTKGITTQRREWRVHVFKGVITYVQKKIRRNGYREDPSYREDVRNHHTGWIYSNQFADTPSAAVLRSAFNSVAALGLDFGAVDIISRQDQAWVLEVNTAPGLSGTTLETYQHNVVEFAKHVVTGSVPAYRQAYETPAPIVRATAAVEEASDENFAIPAETPPAPQPEVAAMPQTQVETSGLNIDTVTTNQLRNAARGFYLANINSEANGDLSARNVVIYISDGRAFRHGWNLPLSAGTISGLRRIESFTIENNHTVPAY